MSLCQDGIRGWNHFAFMWIVFTFVELFSCFHSRGHGIIVLESGVSIHMWSAVEIAWLAHRCRSKQIFGSAKNFCPNFPKLARKVLGDIACKFFPSKIMKTFFGMTSKKGLHVFFCKNTILWAPLYEIKQDWEPFCPDFERLCPDF